MLILYAIMCYNLSIQICAWTNKHKLGIQKYYITLFGLRLYEYVVELGVLLSYLDPEI